MPPPKAAAVPEEWRRFAKPSDLPPELRGPTGLEFKTPSGRTATELVSTYGPEDDGGFHNVPLLVPGQEGVKQLLKGKEPTPEQIRRAFGWYRRSGGKGHKSLEAALSAVHDRHAKLEDAVAPDVGQRNAIYRYGDRNAALLMKRAKHDPGTAPAVHAARRLVDQPVTIHTERWGKPGRLEEFDTDAQIERGDIGQLRGLWRLDLAKDGADAEIDLRAAPRDTDAVGTLGHEVGHHILNNWMPKNDHLLEGTGPLPKNSAEEEYMVDQFGRENWYRKGTVPSLERRQELKGIVARLLEKEMHRSRELPNETPLRRLGREMEEAQADRKVDGLVSGQRGGVR